MNEKRIKAITFSFDDGVEDDRIVVDILNRYGLKGTFNLNGALMSNTDNLSWCYNNQKTVRHLNCIHNTDLYDGHEIACHGYTHQNFKKIDRETAENEIELDKLILEHVYKRDIRGFAYPFGIHSDDLIDILKKNGIEYARTVASTKNFDLPENPLLWNPTCHFLDAEMMNLAEAFLNCEGNAVFYIWGHSYELVTEQDVKKFEEFCAFIANREDIDYLTNIEIIDLMKQNL